MISIVMRALVTRPWEESKALAAALAMRGIEALIEPLMEVHFLAPPALDLRGVQALLCTSANGSDLVRLVAGRLRPHEGQLLHVAGNVVAGDLAGALHTQGFTVTRSVLYEARSVEKLSPVTVRALSSGTIAFAMFFSPRTAAVFARLVDEAGAASSCGRMTAFSISPAADATLAGLPWLDRVVAPRPDQPALLAALDRVLGNRQQG